MAFEPFDQLNMGDLTDEPWFGSGLCLARGGETTGAAAPGSASFPAWLQPPSEGLQAGTGRVPNVPASGVPLAALGGHEAVGNQAGESQARAGLRCPPDSSQPMSHVNALLAPI